MQSGSLSLLLHVEGGVCLPSEQGTIQYIYIYIYIYAHIRTFGLLNIIDIPLAIYYIIVKTIIIIIVSFLIIIFVYILSNIRLVFVFYLG